MKRGYCSIYGTVQLKKVYCKKCFGYSFVIDGIKQCCLEPSESQNAKEYKMESQCCGKRKRPKMATQKRILQEQENRCLYCKQPIKRPYERFGKLRFTRLNWDHLIPYAYLQDNPNNNWVASCSICNLIKSDKVFDTIEEVIFYVCKKKESKGIVEL